MALNCTSRALVVAQVPTLRSTVSFNVRSTSSFTSVLSTKAAALNQRRVTTAIVASAAEGEVTGESLHSTPSRRLNTFYMYISLWYNHQYIQ